MKRQGLIFIVLMVSALLLCMGRGNAKEDEAVGNILRYSIPDEDLRESILALDKSHYRMFHVSREWMDLYGSYYDAVALRNGQETLEGVLALLKSVEVLVNGDATGSSNVIPALCYQASLSCITLADEKKFDKVETDKILAGCHQVLMALVARAQKAKNSDASLRDVYAIEGAMIVVASYFHSTEQIHGFLKIVATCEGLPTSTAAHQRMLLNLFYALIKKIP